MTYCPVTCLKLFVLSLDCDCLEIHSITFLNVVMWGNIVVEEHNLGYEVVISVGPLEAMNRIVDSNLSVFSHSLAAFLSLTHGCFV